MVARVEKDLLTPYGLRTLEKNSAGYVGRYGGRVQTRDQAYHNGTAWPWLIAPLGCALRTLGDSKRFTEIQNQFQEHLRHGCLGQICEVADGDLPQNAGGCVGQAWSVAAMLDQGIGETPPPR
jgi:glycogen debranching enzyme